MTRAGVLKLGLLALLLGPLGYFGFRYAGFNPASAGIAAEALFILIVLLWIGSYLFRVISGQMTFMEQRKRYIKAYENVTNKELLQRFNDMSQEEQKSLLDQIELEKKSLE